MPRLSRSTGRSLGQPETARLPTGSCASAPRHTVALRDYTIPGPSTRKTLRPFGFVPTGVDLCRGRWSRRPDWSLSRSSKLRRTWSSHALPRATEARWPTQPRRTAARGSSPRPRVSWCRRTGARRTGSGRRRRRQRCGRGAARGLPPASHTRDRRLIRHWAAGSWRQSMTSHDASTGAQHAPPRWTDPAV